LCGKSEIKYRAIVAHPHTDRIYKNEKESEREMGGGGGNGAPKNQKKEKK
jgi:hypothetical protein